MPEQIELEEAAPEQIEETVEDLDTPLDSVERVIDPEIFGIDLTRRIRRQLRIVKRDQPTRYNSRARNINDAFSWDRTTQGRTFWRAVYRISVGL
jgi:hypothetical protein